MTPTAPTGSTPPLPGPTPGTAARTATATVAAPETPAPTMTVAPPSTPPPTPRSFATPPTQWPAPTASDESTADRLARGATDAAAAATGALGTAADAAGDFARRQQPLVMAVAFGLGVFLGILIRRR